MKDYVVFTIGIIIFLVGLVGCIVEIKLLSKTNKDIHMNLMWFFFFILNIGNVVAQIGNIIVANTK